jgi:hypothetical protein
MRLEAMDCEIDAVVDLLAGGAGPVWKQDVSKGPEAPVPNLLGELRLQRTLVARSLQLAALGRMDGAERALAASWTLNGSLRDRADLMSQIVAIGVARMQAGLMRRISLPPASVASWRELLAGHDFRESVLRALRLESLTYARSLSPGKSLFERASHVDYLDARRMMLVRMRDEPVSDGPLRIAEPTDLTDPPMSAGAILSTLAVPNLLNTVRRTDRLIVDLELTDRVLQVRELRAKLGHWPDHISGIERSRIANGHWVYSVDAKGRMSIAFSRDLLWDGVTGLVLPLRYESDDSVGGQPRGAGSAGRE